MKTIITLATLAIMASPSFAATTKKTVTKTTTTTTNTAPARTATHTSSDNSMSNNYSAHSVSHDGINWQAGVGLGTAGSKFHFGARVQGLVPVTKIEGNDLLVGGETGFLFGPSSSSSWVIPIMAAGQLNFKPLSSGKITPYAGLAMGVGIFHSDSTSVTILGFTSTSGGGSSTDFALFAKGGLYFGEEQKLFAELPLGTLGSAFAIFPTFGMRF